MLGSDEPPLDPIAKALADLAQQVASLLACLEALEARHPATTTITITGAQQIQAEGEKLQQIEQPTDVTTEPAGKMLILPVLAAVRLQAAASGLLRQRVQEMRNLQLIPPGTPSQRLQVAHHCAEDLDLVRCVGDLRHVVPPTGSRHAISPAGSNSESATMGVGEAHPSSLPCAAWTSSHLAGRKHGLTGRHAPISTAAFHHRPPRGHIRLSLLRPLPGLDTRQTAPWDPGGHPRAPSSSGWCPPSIEEAAKK